MAAVMDSLVTRLDLENLGGYTSGLRQAGGAVGRFGAQIIGAAGGAVGILGFFGKAALAAGEDAATFTRAAGNFKGAFPADELSAFAGGLEELTGVADDSIGGFMGLLGTFNVTKQAAKELALPILNASEALKEQGVTTAQLAVQVGKALQTGDPSALRRSGIIIEDTGFKMADAAGRAAILAKALQAQGGDAALEHIKTLPGAIQAAKTSIDSLIESIGEPLIEPLKEVAQGVAGFAKWLKGAGPEAKILAGIIIVGPVAAFAALTIAMKIAEYQAYKTMAAVGRVGGLGGGGGDVLDAVQRMRGGVGRAPVLPGAGGVAAGAGAAQGAASAGFLGTGASAGVVGGLAASALLLGAMIGTAIDQAVGTGQNAREEAAAENNLTGKVSQEAVAGAAARRRRNRRAAAGITIGAEGSGGGSGDSPGLAEAKKMVALLKEIAEKGGPVPTDQIPLGDQLIAGAQARLLA